MSNAKQKGLKDDREPDQVEAFEECRLGASGLADADHVTVRAGDHFGPSVIAEGGRPPLDGKYFEAKSNQASFPLQVSFSVKDDFNSFWEKLRFRCVTNLPPGSLQITGSPGPTKVDIDHENSLVTIVPDNTFGYFTSMQIFTNEGSDGISVAIDDIEIWYHRRGP
ncbi:hypothetical protein L2Y96_13400 [Luteibacter aegosomaticola]|uniref:hypothetical protein n=1 Tax=Luteibacter aegosomaticola TaxID=2911538 RepID=UPI001FF80F25|nr:hypothetical protein [Luteibacter aegosomaticola]UPG88415.1 hypothetical protein L2Y96_13400 [Luteibacter aegosomaticola]